MPPEVHNYIYLCISSDVLTVTYMSNKIELRKNITYVRISSAQGQGLVLFPSSIDKPLQERLSFRLYLYLTLQKTTLQTTRRPHETIHYIVARLRHIR
jgi:hypothetical protein